MTCISKSRGKEISTLARRRGGDDVERRRSCVFSRRIVQIGVANVGEKRRIVKDLYKKSGNRAEKPLIDRFCVMIYHQNIFSRRVAATDKRPESTSCRGRKTGLEFQRFTRTVPNGAPARHLIDGQDLLRSFV